MNPELFSIALLAAIGMALPAGAQPWSRPELPYRIRIEVETTLKNAPVPAEIDFAGALRASRIAGTPDADSIVVMDGRNEVPIHVSDPVYDFGGGRVSWLVRSPGRRSFCAYFDILEHGKAAFRGYQEPVGIGDSFHYNRPGGFDPLGVGMMCDQTAAVDWDGDGKVDLLQRNLYSYAGGQPYWGIFFWRNIGTDRNPVFDRYIRLKADGRYIGDVYNTFQVIDWNGDGNPDILYGIGGGSRRGAMRIYLNSGKRDPLGMPVLVAGPELTREGGGDLNYGMRLLDWTGGSRPDLYTLRMRVEYFPTPVVNHTWYRHPNLAESGTPPRFGPGHALPLGGKTTYDESPSDFYDWDGDGALDLIGSTGDLHSNPPRTCVMVWKNTGTRDMPAFEKPPFCAPEIPPGPWSIPAAVHSPAFHGLFLTYMGGWLRYFEQDPRDKAARFADRGALLARGQACSSGGYDSVEVADWEGDGDLDLIVGNESGYVQLIENISAGGRTMFASPKMITAGNGEPMRVARWNFLNDGDPEWNLGQSKPTCADWDGDGDLDLLVGNNANRIAWFENIGTRSRPRFAPMRKLTHDGGEHFSFRKRPAVVDWNGDGLPDLVAGYSGERERVDPDGRETVCLFLRYRDKDGRLHLRQGAPLKLADGSEFRLPIPYNHGFEAADWDGDGDYDLFTNEQGKLYVYVNEGDNARPVFRRTPLTFYGQPIELSHHETSVKVVDWDRDGRPDLIAGAESGWTYFFRRAALDSSAPPVVRTGPLECSGGPCETR